MATPERSLSARRLRESVERLEGPRNPRSAPGALAAAESMIADELAALGMAVERMPFEFRGETYRNVVGTLAGSGAAEPALIVGAHFDTIESSPGADDNASGVAVMLEVARQLAHSRPVHDIQFVAFNLEEPQDGLGNYLIGSQRFATHARRTGRRLLGALVLEMVGYTDPRPRSQKIPFPVLKRVPDSGTFLAAVGDRRSRRLLRSFARIGRARVSDLPIVTYRVWLRGYAMPLTRLSDNASFWDQRYPALMITDTAFLRNPNYHRSSDRADTLDYEFMAKVARAVSAAAAELSGSTEYL